MLSGANIVILDLEVAHSPDDLPTGWRDKQALGLSIGGYWDYQDARIHWFDRATLAATMALLVERHPLLVSFNGELFDFALMRALVRHDATLPGHLASQRQELCDHFKVLASRGYDLLQEVWRVAGRSTVRGLNSLEALCLANNLGQKTGNGSQAPRLWARGQIADVLNYCQHDIYLTKALFEYVLATRGVLGRRDDTITIALPLLENH